MTQTQNECEARWGDGTEVKNWVRRIDVVLADERVSKYPAVKRRLQKMRRHALKCDQERLAHIQQCKDGLYTHTKWSSQRYANQHFGRPNSNMWWCCPTKNRKQHEASCPFCQDDWRTIANVSERLTATWTESDNVAESWNDLSTPTNPYTHDFSDPAIQDASRDCVVLAGVSFFIGNDGMTDNKFYLVLVDGKFVKVYAGLSE